MDLLRRSLAPLLPAAWRMIDEEARRVLEVNLAGRTLVDVTGPAGWEHAAENLGRAEACPEPPCEGVDAAVREVQPLVELRTSIALDRGELDRIAAGLDAPDLRPVEAAAERMARAEDTALFHGFTGAGIQGLCAATPHDPIAVGSTPDAWPDVVTQATETLREAGIGGPYGLALGPGPFRDVARGAEDGYPIRRRIEQLIEHPPAWAPVLEGGVLVSLRGGDFRLALGQDHAIGYAAHDRDHVELYLLASFTFRVLEPAAAVVLRRA
ncbi:MAG: family 1 encapsulin nanocompartment shell protein [Planctomycetota bacterium]